MEFAGEDVRVRQRRDPPRPEIQDHSGLDQTAHLFGPDAGARSRDGLPIDPIVRVDEHEQAAALRQDVVVERVLLAAAVVVMGAGLPHGPIGGQDAEAWIAVHRRARPVVAGDDDAKVRIRLRAHRREREVEQRLDQGPVPRAAGAPVRSRR
ncbi:hypothetical protein [Methylobacterium nigriterrae]|uniref:hypothetical protein n=1 Tax=Methylobacterium nigriterrae TaxID=3127512 RepID=UPI00301403EF